MVLGNRASASLHREGMEGSLDALYYLLLLQAALGPWENLGLELSLPREPRGSKGELNHGPPMDIPAHPRNYARKRETIKFHAHCSFGSVDSRRVIECSVGQPNNR